MKKQIAFVAFSAFLAVAGAEPFIPVFSSGKGQGGGSSIFPELSVFREGIPSYSVNSAMKPNPRPFTKHAAYPKKYVRRIEGGDRRTTPYAFEEMFESPAGSIDSAYARSGKPFFIYERMSRPPFFLPTDGCPLAKRETYEAWKKAHPGFIAFNSLWELDSDTNYFENFYDKMGDDAISKELHAVFCPPEKVGRAHRVRWAKRLFKIAADFHFGEHGIFPLCSGNVGYEHIFGAMGASGLWYEATTQSAGPWNTAAAFVRGAARQRNLDFGWYMAHYMTGWTRAGKTVKGHNMHAYGYKGLLETPCPHRGESRSLFRRKALFGWLSGAKYLQCEAWSHLFIDRVDGKDVPSENARDFNEIYELSKTTARGVPYAPLAVLTPLAEPCAVTYLNEKLVDPKSQTDIFNTLVPFLGPDGKTTVFRKKGDQGCLFNSRFANFFDVLCPDSGQPTAEFQKALGRYRHVLLAGEAFNAKTMDRKALEAFAAAGGVVHRYPSAECPDRAALEKLLLKIQDETLPVAVDGDVQWGVNRVDGKDGCSWLVYLINNKGVVKFCDEPEVLDPSKTVRVKVTFRATGESRQVDVGPGDFRLMSFVAPDELKVSAVGFDKADSTRFLQAAIDSGAKRVVLDRMAAPWVTQPLKGVSNQELRFEPGTELVAKRGEYRDVRSVMFSFENAANVTISGSEATVRMWAEDYMSKDYSVSEWRHAFSFLSCENVKILGLTIDGSGGDGIYLGSRSRERPSCRNVVIRDVVSKRNVRQGISVISAENLLIENCKLIDTVGRPPESGIDFEPNQPHQRLVNVVMRNCEMSGNKGDGITISLQHFFRRTEPISLTIENCVTRDNEYSFRCSQNSKRGNFLQGFIAVRNCTFAESRLSGLHFLQKTGEAFPVTFENCRLENSCRKVPDSADVTFDSRVRGDAPPDGIRFEGLEIVAPVVREPFAFTHAGWCDEPVKAITGRVTLRNPEGTKTLELDETFRSRFSPVRVGPVHAPIELDAAKVVDGCPDKMVGLTDVALRGTANYVFYADRPKTVRFAGGGRILKARRAPLGKMVVRALQGDWRTVRDTPVGSGEFAVKVPAAGFYALEVVLGAQVFHLRSASAPIALWLKENESIGIFKSIGTLYLRTERPFAFHVSGEGFAERVGAEILDPSGTSVWKMPAALRWETCRVSDVKDGLWRIRLMRPTISDLEDYHIDLTGASPMLFLSDKRWW